MVAIQKLNCNQLKVECNICMKMNKKLIVVLGMHRSGTSAITRGLQVLGVGLGDKMLPAVEGNNSKGFWEDADLNALNIEMLSALNKDWHHLVAINQQDVDVLRNKGYLQRALDLLQKKTDDTPVYGFKDPRVAKLLPFWRLVFDQCQLETHYLLAVRHPHSVVDSLSKRDGFEPEQSYLMWLGHVVSSLSGSVGKKRVMVDYDSLMQSPARELNRIANCFGLKIDPAELNEFQTEFLDPGLRHTAYDINDLLLEETCPPLVREIFSTLQDVSSDKLKIDDSFLGNSIARWVVEFERLKSSLSLADKISVQKKIAVQTIAERDRQIVGLNQELVERDTLVGNLGRTIESLIIDRDSLKTTVELLQASVEEVAHERIEMVSQLSREVADRDAQIGNVGRTIESLVKDRDSLKSTAEVLQATIEKLTYEREEHISQLSHVVAEREKQLVEITAQLSTVYSSKSWRLTSPLRSLVRIVTRISEYVANRRWRNSQITSSEDQQAIPNLGTKGDQFPKKESGAGYRILLVSYYCPSRAHAGGLRILDIYALIREHCPNVQIDLLTFHRPTIDWSLDDVNRTFHNVYLSPVEELTPEILSSLRGSTLHYDVVDLQFHQTGRHINAFKHIGSKIIFTPMESLVKVALINLRHNLLTTNINRLRDLAASLRLAAEEVVFAKKVDEVVCVSQADADLLRTVTLTRHVCGMDTGVSKFEFADALETAYKSPRAANRRCSIIFVAYFGSPTNVAALRWYLDNVHPLVKAAVPTYVLTIVGRGDLSSFSSYQDNSIEFVGEVDAVAPYIREARIGIAVALSGSGFRGKVNQYAILGVPSVVTPIAHKGLAYQDGENIFVAKQPGVFAERCIRLLTDLELNDRMGLAARELCLKNYSWQSKWPAIRDIYNLGKEEVENAAA